MPEATDYDRLTEGGKDVVSGTQHADITRVVAPAAVTSAHAAGNPPTQTEYNKAVDDIIALRATVASLTTQLNLALDTLDTYGETA